jgi:hypothetical protein
MQNNVNLMRYIIIIILLLIVSSVSALDPSPHINSIFPNSAYNVGVVTITIHGDNLNPIEIYISKCGNGYVVGNIISKSSTDVTAEFNIKGRTPGNALVRLNNADGQIVTFPFTVLEDISTPIPTLTTTYYNTYVTDTPGYSTTTAEPDEVITYIYNIPTPTYLIPLNQRNIITTTPPIQQRISTIATTIPTPTPIKIVPIKTQKSPLEIIVIILSLFCIVYIIIKK